MSWNQIGGWTFVPRDEGDISQGIIPGAGGIDYGEVNGLYAFHAGANVFVTHDPDGINMTPGMQRGRDYDSFASLEAFPSFAGFVVVARAFGIPESDITPEVFEAFDFDPEE